VEAVNSLNVPQQYGHLGPKKEAKPSMKSRGTIPIRPTTNAAINSRRWHNYIELNQDESIGAAGFQSLGKRE